MSYEIYLIIPVGVIDIGGLVAAVVVFVVGVSADNNNIKMETNLLLPELLSKVPQWKR